MKIPFPLFSNRYGVFALMLMFTSCHFPKAVSLLKQGDIAKAKPKFIKATKHPTYDVGAKYYLQRLKINEDINTFSWLDINLELCQLQEDLKKKSIPQLAKLSKYDASRKDFIKARDHLQKRIVDRMSVKGTIPELKALESKSGCWSEGAIDTLRKIVVNKNIDPKQQVYPSLNDLAWEGTPISWPTNEALFTEKGRSCILDKEKWTVNYEDATTIGEDYQREIITSNYGDFWNIRQHAWEIFQLHHSYCEMGQFRREYPNSLVSNDCWFYQARDTLCLGELKPLLTFHNNNPHTVLDVNICNQILCLAARPQQLTNLSPLEMKHVEDVQLMLDLQQQVLYCEIAFDSTELISHIVYLAEKYPHHKVVFELACTAIDYYATRRQYDAAKDAITAFTPLFKDENPCPAEFFFQVGKEGWFRLMAKLLKRAEEESIIPYPIDAWNTADHHEYSLVSWGETDEVFFVRRAKEGAAQIMTSQFDGQVWSKPVSVPKLSTSEDVRPLSMSANGQMMLLKAEGKLFLTFRPDVGRPWLTPEEIPMPSQFAGNAWLSPNDSLLIIEYYSEKVGPLDEPNTSLSVSKLGDNGKYGYATSLSNMINIENTNQENPIMALGGRMLFYTSDQRNAIGQSDMYSANLSKPADWSSIGQPRNLGIPLNTFFNENGLTYFSEYSGKAFFDRYNKCDDDTDIWWVDLSAGVFPESVMRFAGIVLDENDKPISGGFVEFTPDYQLNVHAEPISRTGQYTYTVADSTAVVRLFPEIPGYYSERDTTHFLAYTKRGEIIRDTFRLTSFDYIRRHFELVHSTFFNGEAEFDQPELAYPELTRLAKIATRMGAELELSGHTDDTGEGIDNMQLSYDRANSVKAFLVEKCGFDSSRIRVSGYGATMPICDNDTEEGRRCNRRVEIVFKMPKLEGSNGE